MQLFCYVGILIMQKDGRKFSGKRFRKEKAGRMIEQREDSEEEGVTAPLGRQTCHLPGESKLCDALDRPWRSRIPSNQTLWPWTLLSGKLTMKEK